MTFTSPVYTEVSAGTEEDVANETLSTTGPTKPGIYIGKIYRNQAGPPPGFRRILSIVAKGSRLKTQFNAPIRRAFLSQVALTFTNVSPNVATLAHAALPDQTVASLTKANGTTVSTADWQFTQSVPGGAYDTVLLRPDAYDPNASYLLSYQSTDRTIQDALPFDGLRSMRFVGDYENQSKYLERIHYAVPVTITTPAPSTNPANAHSAGTAAHGWTTITAAAGNTSTVVPAFDVTNVAPAHNYNRLYTLLVFSVVGSTVTLHLQAAQNSGGLASAAPVPEHPSLPNSLYPTGMVKTATTGTANTVTFTDPETGDSIVLDLNLTAATAVVNDSWTFTALGPSMIEVDSGLTNTNQWPTFTAITPKVGNTGTGTVSMRSDSTFTGLSNRNYRLVVSAVTGTSPSRTATFLWTSWGESAVTTGTFTITESTNTNALVALDQGITLAMAFGGTNFAVGDTYNFTALTARRYITAKDARHYTFTVSSAIAGVVSGLYQTDTAEGRFGTITAQGPDGQVRLPGDIDLWVRNIGTTVAQNRYVANDSWTWMTADEQVIDWSLTSRNTETILPSNFLTDVLGTVTGTVGAKFAILSELPTALIYVRDSSTKSVYSTAALVSGKPVVVFPVVPSAAVEVQYEYTGLEPAPGAWYYVTADTLRPLSLFNTPIFYANYDDAAAPALGPAATDNDALIAAQLILKDCGAPGLYVTQVYDSDSDGIYTSYDYNTAIQKNLAVSRNSDLIVIGKADTLPAQMVTNEAANNPFKGHVNQALWVGMPTGSIVGDIDTAGSIVFMAKRTLQVPQQSQAKGTRALIANPAAKKTIALGDGTQVQVNLDGSYIAAAVAAINASFDDPNTLLMKQVVPGFDWIQTFDDDEELSIIDASAIYIYNDGSADIPVYKISEGITVHTESDDVHEINVAFNVRTFTQADMRAYLDDTVIGIVPGSGDLGAAAYQTSIALRMGQWWTDKIVGDWEDAAGNPRSMEPTTDIVVWRSKTRKTLYYFKYAWFARYGSTRGYGLYAVDTANLASPTG